MLPLLDQAERDLEGIFAYLLAKMIFTLEEKRQIIKWYYGGNTLNQIAQLFVVAYERGEPARSCIHSVIQQFEKYGCIRNCKNCRDILPRRNNDTEMQEVFVCAAAERDLSVRAIASELDISSTQVFKILKKNGYRSFKVSTSNEIFLNDKFRRMEFCERIMEMINEEPTFLDNILFTDESSFSLHAIQSYVFTIN